MVRIVEVLAAFGLTHDEDGSWIMPAPLREFARTALAGSLTTRRGHGTDLYDYVQSGAW
ncbi:hypothetical protein IF188_00210 [Microbacterium sp. NEAU-LLC]|uniref:Uncharacterized protein n=1 Tax=Microbacterium helvum TaxID=2773713 RepID=A0ABR8NHE8_9MICO|nr:hypothetical protein [Microbacterium helvum]MBD3940119.1 hypothetical protein [Microbacterium helvum]